MPPRFEHEHDDEHEDDLVADLGVSSVERYAALRLCGESPSGLGVCDLPSFFRLFFRNPQARPQWVP